MANKSFVAAETAPDPIPTPAVPLDQALQEFNEARATLTHTTAVLTQAQGDFDKAQATLTDATTTRVASKDAFIQKGEQLKSSIDAAEMEP